MWGAGLCMLPLLAAVVLVLASPASDLLQEPRPVPPISRRRNCPRWWSWFSMSSRRGRSWRGRWHHRRQPLPEPRRPRRRRRLVSPPHHRGHEDRRRRPVAPHGKLPTTVPPLWTSHPDSLFTLLAPTHSSRWRRNPRHLTLPVHVLRPRGGGRGREPRALRPRRHDRGPVGGAGASRPGAAACPRRLRGAGDAGPHARADRDRRGRTGCRGRPSHRSHVGSHGGAGGVDRSRTRTHPLRFLHLVLPHQPWERWPDGERYSAPPALGSGLPDVDQDEHRYSWSEWTAAISEQRHLLQAEYTDRLVGSVLDQLRAEGLYDESLVVVVGDHGVSFEPRSSAREVDASTVDAIGYAPLIVKAPGQRDGQVDDSNVQIVDVLPTMADLLGLDVPWDVDGVAAGSSASLRGTKVIYDLGPYLEPVDIIEFDDAATFPTVSDRWIRGPRDPNNPLSGLQALLGDDDLLGQEIDAAPSARNCRGGRPRLAATTSRGPAAACPGDRSGSRRPVRRYSSWSWSTASCKEGLDCPATAVARTDASASCYPRERWTTTTRSGWRWWWTAGSRRSRSQGDLP